MRYRDCSKMTYSQLRDSNVLGRMERRVFDALLQLGEATAKDLMQFLQETDPNRVRPRLTGLLDKGIVRGVGQTAQDGYTHTLWSLNLEPVTVIVHKRAPQVTLKRWTVVVPVSDIGHDETLLSET